MPNTTRDYVKAMVNAMDSKRGEDIQVLKVADLTSIAEYFVICSATSTTQVKTLADEVEFKLKTDYEVMPHHVDSAGLRLCTRSCLFGVGTRVLRLGKAVEGCGCHSAGRAVNTALFFA